MICNPFSISYTGHTLDTGIAGTEEYKKNIPKLSSVRQNNDVMLRKMFFFFVNQVCCSKTDRIQPNIADVAKIICCSSSKIIKNKNRILVMTCQRYANKVGMMYLNKKSHMPTSFSHICEVHKLLTHAWHLQNGRL